MNTKHTPGPWKIKRRKHVEHNYWHYQIEHTSTMRDTFVAWQLGPVWLKPTKGKPYRNKEGLANARLIAAAPELLAIVKAISNAINDKGITTLAFLRQEAEEIIAKAEGRDSLIGEGY